MLFSGSARMIVPISDLGRSDIDSLKEYIENKRFVVFGLVKIGDIFGESSAIEDEPNPWTIEVTSKKATIYKIHRSNFIQHFGGHDGAPARHL